MAPTEKHRERAGEIYAFVLNMADDRDFAIRNLIAVLNAAEREGMKRAAEIARQAGDTWSGSRDHTQAAQEAAVDAKCEEIATAILSEAGKDE